MRKTIIKADIIVEVVIEADSVWDEDTKISQIKKQALDDFNHKIKCINSPSIQSGVSKQSYGVQVASKPKVRYIIVEDEKG